MTYTRLPITRSSTVPASFTNFGGALGIILRSGMYHFTIPVTTTGTANTLGSNALRLHPFWVPRDVTLTRIGAEVSTTGDVGSTVRLGMYNDDGTGYPSTLKFDAGTIAGDSATVQEITISQSLTAGLYWAATAVQGVTTTQPTLRTYGTTSIAAIGSSSIPTAAVQWQGYIQNSVTGAFPASFTSSPTMAGSVARVFVKVA